MLEINLLDCDIIKDRESAIKYVQDLKIKKCELINYVQFIYNDEPITIEEIEG